MLADTHTKGLVEFHPAVKPLGRLIVPSDMPLPVTGCPTCPVSCRALNVDTEICTMGFLATEILMKGFGMAMPEVSCGSKLFILSFDESDPGDHAMSEQSLKAMGIVHGAVLMCEGQCEGKQQLKFSLLVRHCDGMGTHLSVMHLRDWTTVSHAWCTPSAKLAALTVLMVGETDKRGLLPRLPMDCWYRIMNCIPRHELGQGGRGPAAEQLALATYSAIVREARARIEATIART